MSPAVIRFVFAFPRLQCKAQALLCTAAFQKERLRGGGALEDVTERIASVACSDFYAKTIEVLANHNAAIRDQLRIREVGEC